MKTILTWFAKRCVVKCESAIRNMQNDPDDTWKETELYQKIHTENLRRLGFAKDFLAMVRG